MDAMLPVLSVLRTASNVIDWSMLRLGARLSAAS
jgi:hypothetical protein